MEAGRRCGGRGMAHPHRPVIALGSIPAVHLPFRKVPSALRLALLPSHSPSHSHLTIAAASSPSPSSSPSSSSSSVVSSVVSSAFSYSAFPVRFDPLVFSSSLKASFNLVTLCGFIILMQKSGNLPPNTAQVLSQVSFNLAIPCFLLSKVSATIASHSEWSFFCFPLIAIVQIMVGVMLGRLSCFLFLRGDHNGGKAEDKNTVIKEALITVSCAFGNSVSVPLILLNGLLSQADYSAAAGYLALTLIGWSPCLWTLGNQIMSSTSTSGSAKSTSWWKKLMNPPLYGVLFGVLIGAISQLFLRANHGVLNIGPNRMETMFSLRSFMQIILQPILEAAKLLGSAAVPLQSIVLASTLATSSGQETNCIDGKQLNGTTVIARDIDLGGKAFWIITVVRLLIMPLLTMGLLIAIPRRWLPVDPISRLTILVISASPTAQNLVVMAQLHSDTRPFASTIANLLMKQYAISLVTITVWMPIFFSCLCIS